MPKKIIVTGDHELVKAKVLAGLPLEQAIEVAQRQVDYDVDLNERQAVDDQATADRAAAAAVEAQTRADLAANAARASAEKLTAADA